MRRTHAAVLASALGAFGCGRAPAPPDVVLITVDTLRADALGCYGGPGPTPVIDRLSGRGIVFENAVSPMPLTRPAHFSLLTSLYPREHGVVSNALALGPGTLSVTEVLRDAGYATGGFVGTRLLARGSGAEVGFAHFEAPAAPADPAAAVAARARAWIQSLPRDRPLFLWLHLYDPHMPYAPPPEFRPRVPSGPLDVADQVSWPILLGQAARDGGHVSNAVLERARALYAGEVAAADHAIGGIEETLRRRQRPAILALTADHGECFDHGIFFEHSDCLYEGAARVPLVLVDERRLQPARRAAPVELVDVAPTVLALAGVAAPPPFRDRPRLDQGPERQFAVIEGPFLGPEAVRARFERLSTLRTVGGEAVRREPGVEQRAVRDRRWKYLVRERDEELFDLAADAGERRSVAHEQPTEAARLRELLERWEAMHPRATRGPAAPDPAALETLRALGYVQ